MPSDQTRLRGFLRNRFPPDRWLRLSAGVRQTGGQPFPGISIDGRFLVSISHLRNHGLCSCKSGSRVSGPWCKRLLSFGAGNAEPGVCGNRGKGRLLLSVWTRHRRRFFIRSIDVFPNEALSVLHLSGCRFRRRDRRDDSISRWERRAIFVCACCSLQLGFLALLGSSGRLERRSSSRRCLFSSSRCLRASIFGER